MKSLFPSKKLSANDNATLRVNPKMFYLEPMRSERREPNSFKFSNSPKNSYLLSSLNYYR